MHPNFYAVERMTNDHLSGLRAEGIRSQMLAREGVIRRVKLRFPHPGGVVRWIAAHLAGRDVRQIEHAAVRKHTPEPEAGASCSSG